MNSLTRTLGALALVVVLIATPALTALAQGGLPGCQGLSEADCALLHNALTATKTVASFSVPAWTVNFYLSAEQESVFFEASGTAAAAWPDELILLRDTFMAVETATPETVSAFLGQLDANRIQAMLDDLLLSFTVDSFLLEAPEEGFAASGGLVYKERTVYLNLPAPSGENVWFGEPVTLTNADLDEIDAALEDLRAGFDMPEMDDAFDAAGAMLLVQQGLAALMQPHVTTTRLADESIGGQPVAVFRSTFNLKHLLADPKLAPALLEAYGALAAQNPDLDPVELNQAQLTLVLTVFNLLIAEGTVVSRQWIGLNDGYVHRATVDATLNIDPSLFAEGGEEPGAPVVFDASAAVEMADFNALTPDRVGTPETYHPGRLLEDFLAGTPDMVEQVLAVDDVVANTIPADGDTHIYALPLDAGQTVVLALESDGYPYLHVYNPAAFLVETHSIFAGEPLVFTASASGVHFVTVEGFSALDYTLTVREAEG